MRMRWRNAVLSGVLLVSVGCFGPRVRVTQLGETFPPRVAAEEIKVFSTQAPACPYRELAIVTAYEAEFGDLDEAMAALKGRARDLGADAVVAVRLVSRGGDDPRDGYSGTAVRFSNEDCMH